MNGQCQLAQQHGNWGYYFEVSLEVGLDPHINSIEVEFSEAPSEWEAGIRFGIAYAFEKVQHLLSKRGGARVRIIKSRGFAVDTTQIVAACATARAFWTAVGAFPSQAIVLKAETGEFVFPK